MAAIAIAAKAETKRIPSAIVGPDGDTTLTIGQNALPAISYICSALDNNVWWGDDKTIKVASDKNTPPCLSTPNGDIVGDVAIARCLASPALYSSDPFVRVQIDSWIDFANTYFQGATPVFEALQVLNDYLRLRTFLVGYSKTLADIVVFHSIRTSKMHNNLSGLPNLARWLNMFNNNKIVQTGVGMIKSLLSRILKSQRLAKRTSAYAPLPDAIMGKVRTRFPPEPSGYLHIGHAKAALLNAHYAKEYKGTLLIRFDDTNPAKEKAEYAENIKRDLLKLGIKGDVYSHTSDFFPLIEKKARQLIKKGMAYMDDSSQDEMKAQRDQRVNAPRRDASPKENMKLFEEMLKGSPLGQKFCLRAKIDMQSNNGTLQDPVMYRYKGEPHPRTGDKYKAYPTYDFACPIVDSVEGVTHALRTTEYRDRNVQSQWFVEAMGLRPYKICEFARLNFNYAVMSKRKLKEFVADGEVDGWDDPRMPTIQGMIRRGVQLQALRDFILSQGFSTKVVAMEWDKFWSMNAKLLDKIAPRYLAVTTNSVKLHLSNVDSKIARSLRVQLFPKDPSKGYKSMLLSSTILLEPSDAACVKEGEEITLMRLGNAIIEKLVFVDGKLSEMFGKLNLKGDFRKTKLKLTWVADTELSIPVTMYEFDHLITKKKLEDGDDINQLLTSLKHPTKQATELRGEAAMRLLKADDTIQIERRGFFRVDKAYRRGGSLQLFSIPDGKKKSMSTLASATSKISRR